MRRRFLLALLLVLVLASMVVAIANAGGWSISWGLGSLWAEGWVDGISPNTDASITLTAQGNVFALCQNPGGQFAPGRNPIGGTFEVSQTSLYPTDETGLANFFIEVEDPALDASPTPKSAGCPNGNWQVVGAAVDWTAAHILVVDQSTGEITHDLDFACQTFFDKLGNAIGVECQYAPRQGPF